jgi:hypothetical protein
VSEFYIIDLRPEWLRNPCITLWRPDACGYAYPLAWAGKYDEAEVRRGGSYYAQKGKRYWQRFPVPCEAVEALAAPLASRIVDCWKEGPHILNTGKNRMALRRARYVPTPLKPWP